MYPFNHGMRYIISSVHFVASHTYNIIIACYSTLLNSKAQITSPPTFTSYTGYTTYDNQTILTFVFFPFFIFAKRKRDSAKKPGLVVTCSRYSTSLPVWRATTYGTPSPLDTPPLPSPLLRVSFLVGGASERWHQWLKASGKMAYLPGSSKPEVVTMLCI